MKTIECIVTSEYAARSLASARFPDLMIARVVDCGPYFGPNLDRETVRRYRVDLTDSIREWFGAALRQ